MKSSRGFTLVELLIILVVIAIISVVCFEVYSAGLVKSSREFIIKSNQNNKLLEDKINEYRFDKGNQAAPGQGTQNPPNQNPPQTTPTTPTGPDTTPTPPSQPSTPPVTPDPAPVVLVPILSYEDTSELFLELQDKQLWLFIAHDQALEDYNKTQGSFNTLKDNYFNAYQEYVQLSDLITERTARFNDELAKDVAKSKLENDKYSAIQSEWYAQTKQTEYLKGLIEDYPNLVPNYNQSLEAERLLKTKLDKQELFVKAAVKMVQDNKIQREATIDKAHEKSITDKFNNAKYEYDTNYSYLESEDKKAYEKLYKLKEEYNNTVHKLGDAQRDLIYYHNHSGKPSAPEYDPTIL